MRRRVAGTVPGKDTDANLARFHVSLQLRFQEFVQHSSRSVEFLVWVLPHHDIDAGLLLRVRKVAHKVSLHTRLQLSKYAARKTLLPVLEHARNVALCASILIGELVSILVPHPLQTLLDLTYLTRQVPRLGRMRVFLQVRGLDFVEDFFHDNPAELSLSKVRSVQTVQAVGAEHSCLHVGFVGVSAVDEEALSVWVHQLWLQHSEKLVNITKVVPSEPLVEIKVVDVESVVATLVKQVV